MSIGSFKSGLLTAAGACILIIFGFLILQIGSPEGLRTALVAATRDELAIYRAPEWLMTLSAFLVCTGFLGLVSLALDSSKAICRSIVVIPYEWARVKLRRRMLIAHAKSLG